MMNIINNFSDRKFNEKQINYCVENPYCCIKNAEENYAETIRDIASQAIAYKTQIIMLSGPSASGKTTTAIMLSNALSELGSGALHISLDDFYLEREDCPVEPDGSFDFESIHALDLPLLKNSIEKLFTKGSFEINKFNFRIEHREEKTTSYNLPKGNIAVFEGLHALNPIIISELSGYNTVSIYADTGTKIELADGNVLNDRHIRFMRRLIRDINFRRENAEAIFKIWESVCDGEEKYIKPYVESADIFLRTFHCYEPSLYRSIALPMLKTVKNDSKYYNEANKYIEILLNFNSIDKKLVPADSLLREFIGDSIFKY